MTGPAVRVVKGEPTAEELAALVAALTARTAGSRERPRSLWRDRTALIGAPLTARAGSWRASGLPR